MGEHHLPPEPADHHKGGKAIHADDLKPARGRRYSYYGSTGSRGALSTICSVLLLLILLAGVIALVLYLVYRPNSPAFTVTNIAVYSLSNVTGPSAGPPAAGARAPNAVAASFQCALVIRNPSGRSYRGEAITAPAEMPPLVQDPDSAVVVAPVIGGGGAAPVPVSPETAAALANDVSYGVVSLRVVLLGRVRFVSGPFRTGWRSMYARCDLLVGVRKAPGSVGAAGVPEAPLFGNPSCNVDV
uniref:Late embryogenesis abundant protein LEA-2 subgroup domain-containing protein n=1 Tax=Triticum urartu TaxID=4572 RepID=A0A8R7P6V5_TRIUA